jgi:hypothetical protein
LNYQLFLNIATLVHRIHCPLETYLRFYSKVQVF